MRIFFYGLFMDEALLREQGLRPRVIGRAVLEGYRIHIGERATLLPAEGRRAFGVVMDLTEDEAERLYAEPSVRDYSPERIEVRMLATGESLDALCYNIIGKAAVAGANPAYVLALVAVLEDLGFAPEDIAEVAAYGEDV